MQVVDLVSVVRTPNRGELVEGQLRSRWTAQFVMTQGHMALPAPCVITGGLVQFVPQSSGEPQRKGVSSQVGLRTMMSPNRFWTLGRCPDSLELADLILCWTGEQSSPRRINVAKERPSVFRRLMTTNQSFATAMLRLVLGVLFFAQSV